MLEANRELGKLKVRFPAFEFHLIPGRGRNRFEAVAVQVVRSLPHRVTCENAITTHG